MSAADELIYAARAKDVGTVEASGEAFAQGVARSVGRIRWAVEKARELGATYEIAVRAHSSTLVKNGVSPENLYLAVALFAWVWHGEPVEESEGGEEPC